VPPPLAQLLPCDTGLGAGRCQASLVAVICLTEICPEPTGGIRLCLLDSPTVASYHH